MSKNRTVIVVPSKQYGDCKTMPMLIVNGRIHVLDTTQRLWRSYQLCVKLKELRTFAWWKEAACYYA